MLGTLATRTRAIILTIGGLAVTFGLLPPGSEELLADHAQALLGALALVWGALCAARGWWNDVRTWWSDVRGGAGSTPLG